MNADPYRLPAALEAWKEALELFPEDLRSALGSWLPRLSAALGNFARVRHGDTGEFDGYSGIERRGPYDRLLTSDWAMLELYPDEFLRRAVMGEQSFYESAYQEPSASRRSVVLFDAGPEQLGGPRLAQIALLVVMESRARRAGIELQWGLLQARRPYMGLSRASIVAFLSGRSCMQGTSDDFEAWETQLAVGSEDEYWCIGGPTATTIAKERGKVAIVQVDDSLDPDQTSMCVDFVRGPSAGKRLELRMPATQDAVRLIRDPFTDRRVTGVSHSLVLSRIPRLTFAGQKNRLFALSVDGGLLAFHVPNAPKGTPGRPKRFHTPEGEQVVAAQMQGRRMSIVTMRQETSELVMRGVFGDRSRPPVYCDALVPGAPVAFVAPRGNEPLCSIEFEFFVGRAPDTGCAYQGPIIVDGAGNLFRWSSLAPDRTPEHIASDVFAVFPEWGRFALLASDGTLQVHHHSLVQKERAEPRVVAKFSKVIHVDSNSSDNVHAVALRSEDTIELLNICGPVTISIEPGDRVLGIASYNDEPWVVVIDDRRQSIFLRRPTQRILLASLSSRAIDVVMALDGSHLAWLTEQGHLQVHSFKRAAIVLGDHVEVAP